MTPRVTKTARSPLPKSGQPGRGPYTPPYFPEHETAIQQCTCWFPGMGRCKEPGLAFVVLRCEHGHLREGLVCAEHLAEVSQGVRGHTCRACHHAERSHSCALSLLDVQHREA